jgi:hypothetical protein
MVGGDTLNTVERVDVLVEDNLVAGSGTLTGDNGGVGQEEFPNLREISMEKYQEMDMAYPEPSGAVFGLNLLTVCHPVSVPPPESSAVVDSNGIDTLNLKTSSFKLIDEPTKRGRGISTGEDIFVHEKTPER